MIRFALRAGPWAVCVLLAQPAAAQTCPETLTALSNWYEASPGFAGVGTIRMTATFTNEAGANMEFTPGNTFQIWSVPSVLDIPTVVVSEPSGTVAPDGDVFYDLILDVSGLPASETTFAFRQVDSNMFGTMAPGIIPLQSVSFVCTLAVPTSPPWSLGLLVFGLGVISVLLLRRAGANRPGLSA